MNNGRIIFTGIGLALSCVLYACSGGTTTHSTDDGIYSDREVNVRAYLSNGSSVEAETRAPVYQWAHTDVCFFSRPSQTSPYETFRKATISMYGHVYFRPKLLYKYDKSNTFLKGTHPYEGTPDMVSTPQTMTYILTGAEDVMISNEADCGNIGDVVDPNDNSKIDGVVTYRHVLTQLRFHLSNKPREDPYFHMETIKEVTVFATDNTNPLRNKVVLDLTMDMPASAATPLPDGLVTFEPSGNDIITVFKDDEGKLIEISNTVIQDFFSPVMFEPGKKVSVRVVYGKDGDKTADLSFVPEVSKAYEVTLKFTGTGLKVHAYHSDWVNGEENEIDMY